MAKKTYDLDKIQEAYDTARIRGQAERHAYERNWFRNILFFLGVQWIQYLPNSRLWIPRNLKKWVPRPVTNKFASHAVSIIQVLCSKSPEISCRPGSESPEDVATADVANRALEVILKEAGAKEARKLIAAWTTLTGTAFVHPCYDNDPAHGTTFIGHLQCDECSKTFAPDEAGAGVRIPDPFRANQPGLQSIEDAMNQPPAPAEMSENSCPFCQSHKVSPAKDEDGSEVGEDLPNGKLKLEVFSPFEIHLDLEARSMADVQELFVRRRYPVEVMRRRYDNPDLEPDAGTTDSSSSTGLNLLRAIAYAAGNTQYGTGFASGRGIGDDQNITMDFLWKRPSLDFPDGLVAVFANNKLLNEKDVKDGLPYQRKDGKRIWPWHIVPFDKVPGRIMGKTPLDDVAPKQEQRNKLESMIELIVKRAANPVWLIAKGIGITEITGEPGQILEGNWGMDPRMKPTREPGENIPTSVIAWLQKIDTDMEELAGIFEVMKGSAPQGITAGTALRLLLERAVTRFTPVIEAQEEEFAQSVEELLCIFQQFGTEDRLNMIAGPGDTWEVQRFSAAEMGGSIDVVVEAGSSVPKSAIAQQANIQDLVNMHIVDPMNPDTQYKILEEFGSTMLLGPVDQNIKAAQRENWHFREEKKVPIVDPIIDNHVVHVRIHKGWALTSDFDLLPDPLKMAWRQHIMDHQMYAVGFNVNNPAMSAPGPGLGGPLPHGAPAPGGPVPPGVSPPPSGPPGAQPTPPPGNAMPGGPGNNLPPMPGGKM